MKFYKRRGFYFVGESQGSNVLDVSSINTRYPARECERLNVQEIKDWILFGNGEITPLNSPDKMKWVKAGIEIRYIGDLNYCSRLKKRINT